MASDKLKQTIIIIAHALLIAAAFSSPFWLNWKFVAAGVLLYYVQLLLAGSCVLSIAQFGTKDQTFHEWYLRKLGFNVNRKVLNFILKFIIPPLLVVMAIFNNY